MRIALYKDNLSTRRGADHLIVSQAAAFAELGHDVTLLACPTGQPLSFAVAQTVALRLMPREQVRETVAREGFDVCIAAGSNEILDLTCDGRCDPPVKTVTELLIAPSGLFKWKRFLRNARIKRAFNRSHAVTVLCDVYREAVRRFAPAPRIETIPDWPDIREPSPEELAGAKRRKTILYPAAVNRLKNQLLLVKAFARLAEEFPDWEVHLYGDSRKAYGATCAETARRLGVAERVRFLPFTDNLPAAYASASIMAYPSLLEGLPLALLEGARFGLPAVVVEELPAARNMVADGKTGLVVRNNPKDYADALRKLMADAPLREALGRQARERSLAVYAKAPIMAQWEALLRSLAEERPGSR